MVAATKPVELPAVLFPSGHVGRGPGRRGARWRAALLFLVLLALAAAGLAGFLRPVLEDRLAGR
ncbi:MAG: hypothetical protein ACM34D_11090 [Gemmatimonadota bacterium]